MQQKFVQEKFIFSYILLFLFFHSQTHLQLIQNRNVTNILCKNAIYVKSKSQILKALV